MTPAWLTACVRSGTLTVDCKDYEVRGCNISTLNARASQRTTTFHALPPWEDRQQNGVPSISVMLAPDQLDGRGFCVVGTLQGSGFATRAELVQLMALAGAVVKEGPPRHGEENKYVIVVGTDVRQPERINAWRDAGAIVVQPLFIMDAISRLKLPRIEEHAVRPE